MECGNTEPSDMTMAELMVEFEEVLRDLMIEVYNEFPKAWSDAMNMIEMGDVEKPDTGLVSTNELGIAATTANVSKTQPSGTTSLGIPKHVTTMLMAMPKHDKHSIKPLPSTVEQKSKMKKIGIMADNALRRVDNTIDIIDKGLTVAERIKKLSG